MATNITRLFSNLPLRCPVQERAVFFADSDFTPREGELVYIYTGKPGVFTIVKDRCRSEHFVFVVHKPKGKTPEAKRHFVQETALLKFLLDPAVQCSPLTPESSLETYGNTLMTFDYGPSLYTRLSTASFELKQICKLLDFKSILRVELGRRVVAKLTQFPEDEQLETIQNFLLGGTDLTQYITDRDMRRDIPVTTLTPAVESSRSFFQDPVCVFVMLSQTEDSQPMCIQASTATQPTYMQYIIVTTQGLMSLYPSGTQPQNPSVRKALTHLHAEALLMGHPQLQSLMFHQSLFPFSQNTAAMCGAYALTPNVSTGYYSEQLKETNLCLKSYSHSLNKTGVPVVCGFLRTFDETFNQRSYSTLLSTATLASSAVDILTTSRFQKGDYILALGEFLPISGVDQQPFSYSSSSSVANAIFNTLKLFSVTTARISLTSVSRHPGLASTQDHLFSILPKGGAKIFLASLPSALTKQVSDREHLVDDMLQFISKFYLQTCSSQLFVVLHNGPVGSQRRQGYEFLMRAASLCGCPCEVIGRTCEEPGLHFVNDLGVKTPVEAMGSGFIGTTFSVFQTSKVKKITREHAQAVDIHQRLVTVARGDIDWEMYNISSVLHQILSHPTVGSKEFFVRHSDRCGNGLVMQQPGVGPLDLPLADYSLVVDPAVTSFTGHSFTKEPNPFKHTFIGVTPAEAEHLCMNYDQWFQDVSHSAQSTNTSGHILAVGEQGYKMLLNPFHGVHYGITELLTNMMLGPKCFLPEIQLTVTVHWNEGPDFRMELERVMFACKEFCVSLGVTSVFSSACSSSQIMEASEPADPNALNLFTFVGKVQVDTSNPRLTPELQLPGSHLLYLSVSKELLLTGSVFEHSMSAYKQALPPIDPTRVLDLFQCVQTLISQGLVVSGHDVSDGGLFTCCVEMALAGQMGISVSVESGSHPLNWLLSETPGVVLEVPKHLLAETMQTCEAFGCFVRNIGTVGSRDSRDVLVLQEQNVIFKDTLQGVLNSWTSMADEQFLRLAAKLNEDEMYRKEYGNNDIDLGVIEDACVAKSLKMFRCPSCPVGVAVLCLPGCPRPLSMMAALVESGFSLSLLGLSDLVSKNSLKGFIGLTVSGTTGFQMGYVGSRGLVQSLINNPHTRENISSFLNRKDTFSLCCGELGFEFLSAFKALEHPSTGGDDDLTDVSFQSRHFDLEETASQLHESLWLSFYVPINTRSLMLSPLRGTTFPCWINGTHLGVRFLSDGLEYSMETRGMVSLFFQGPRTGSGHHARHYPRNPSGNSPVAGLCSLNGRHLALLCDPSLAFYPWQWQHIPRKLQGLKTSPWAVMFHSMFLHCVKNSG
ncbi:hypothetical protein [Rhinolophus gammaherpesvirus 1]|uniref:Uncharacterized protein n=1 Tax=Rhinolophus gammaherpesvirus 1 TaxID=2054179 RepID=A0A2Z5U670_9GAMA|nr:hypothetical protein [Rhinolophus gammaherpesvirus 1]BBB06528.1 hypothetical protein [Rhinolophus gammaherpesvirus 1]